MRRCRCHLAPLQTHRPSIRPSGPAIKYGNARVHLLLQGFQTILLFFFCCCRRRNSFWVLLSWFSSVGGEHEMGKEAFPASKEKNWSLRKCVCVQCRQYTAPWHNSPSDGTKWNWMSSQRPPTLTKGALAPRLPPSMTPWIYLRSGQSFRVGRGAVKCWDTSPCKFWSRGPREESQRGPEPWSNETADAQPQPHVINMCACVRMYQILFFFPLCLSQEEFAFPCKQGSVYSLCMHVCAHAYMHACAHLCVCLCVCVFSLWP